MIEAEIQVDEPRLLGGESGARYLRERVRFEAQLFEVFKRPKNVAKRRIGETIAGELELEENSFRVEIDEALRVERRYSITIGVKLAQIAQPPNAVCWHLKPNKPNQRQDRERIECCSHHCPPRI